VNFMGVGPLEMGIVLLVAFLVLGPSRSMDMAKTAGKVMRDIRRTFGDVAAAANLDLKNQPSPTRDPAPRDSSPQAALPPQDQEDPGDQEKGKPSEASDE